MLTAKINQTIERFHMLKPGDVIVVAVSGGPDSICLLSLLHELSGELGISLHVAHLDHMFRGKESAEEALFVKNVAEKLGIPATIEKRDVPGFCKERGVSPQEGARTVRYQFLQEVAKKTNATRIATGHTADDQGETFLMRLIRGAGPGALSSIPPIRENIIRPLIETTRDEIMAYLKENGIDFRTDPSNAKPIYTRNRIRLSLLPVLKEFNPKVVEALAAEAALLRDENEAVEIAISEITSRTLHRENDTVTITREPFLALPKAFQRKLFRKAVDLAGIDPSLLSMVQIEKTLLFIATAQTGRRLELLHGVCVEREYEKFILSCGTMRSVFSFSISIPGITVIPELGFSVEGKVFESSDREELGENYLWQAEFDYDKIQFPLAIRSRGEGDWFCPAGMGGKSKKLQDYFVDEKIPRRKRDTVPLLVCGSDIAWIVGFRTDNRFLTDAGTKKRLFIGIKAAAQDSKN